MKFTFVNPWPLEINRLVGGGLVLYTIEVYSTLEHVDRVLRKVGLTPPTVTVVRDGDPATVTVTSWDQPRIRRALKALQAARVGIRFSKPKEV